jgi:dihydrofolate reductase
MFTLYNIVSADGFIARKDGSEDFIPDSSWRNFMAEAAQYGSHVMGKGTYEAMQIYEMDELAAYEKLPIQRIVISGNRNYAVKPGYTATSSPEEAALIAPNALVSSGPTLNQYLLDHAMVGKIILHKLSESIGDGIKPFAAGNYPDVLIEIHSEL